MKKIACFFSLFSLFLLQLASPQQAQAQTLLNPVVVNSFPTTLTGVNTDNGETAIGMQGGCPNLPCCSTNVYKVVLPTDGVLRVEMLNFTPLAGSIIAYRPLVATPTAFSDLSYVAATVGNFCGFRDTLQLGRGYEDWDLFPYGQVPNPEPLFTSVYDFSAPSTQAGFFPAGDYYLLVFTGNAQAGGLGLGSVTDLTFEFVQACEPLDAPSALPFGSLEPNAGKDTLSLYIKNNRSLDVTIDANTGAVISGTDASQFSILTYPDTLLAVGDSSLIEVAFEPISGGNKSAQLVINFADTICSADNSVTLSGIGTEPQIALFGNGVSISQNSLTPSLNNFTNLGAVVVNTGSVTRSYLIVNQGSDTLELNGSSTVDLQGGSQFTLASNPVTTLLPGDSTTFSVTFTPTTIGLDTAQISIANNDANLTPFTFRITAAGAGLNGLDFDGSGDYVNIDGVASDMVGINTFTVEAWVKVDPNQSGNDMLVGVNTSSNGSRMFIKIDDGVMEFDVGTSSDQLSGPDLRDDVWHHVAFVFNNGTIQYYVDGVLEDTETNSVPAFNANDQWSIGQEWDNGGASDFFNGAVNEFRLWKTVRTAAEIEGGRYCEANGLDADLVTYYSFNQGVAGVSNTTISTLTDNSGNSNDGTLVGFALNGTESNFILADNVGAACTSFVVQVCDAPTYTTPSGMIIDTNGLILDTIPNSSGGDSALVIDLTINFTEVAISNLSDTSFCGGSSYSGQMNTNLTTTYNFSKANSDYVTLNGARDSLVNTNRSIFLWMRAAGQVDGSNQILVGINTSGTNTVSNFGIRTNEELWIYDGGSNRNSGVTVTDTNWHFVGYTYDEGSNLTQFWVDGVAAASFSNGQSISATSRISFGQEFDGTTPSNFFDGEMTEVSFWNEVLDSTDIASIMQSAITTGHSKYNNLMAYYPGNGQCGADGLTIPDMGPYSYNGIATSSSIINIDSLVALPGFDATSHYNVSVSTNGGVVATGNPFTIATTTNGTHVASLKRDFFAVSDSFDIMSFASPVASILQGDSTTFIAGDSVQLTTNTQSGVNYEWFKGFTEDWRILGNEGFSQGGIGNADIQVAPDGNIYAAFKDLANSNGITVMHLVNNTWQTVGSPNFGPGSVGEIDFKIHPNGTLYVAFADQVNSGGATVMYYDGTAWQLVGTTAFSAGSVLNISLEISPSGFPYVGYRDLANANRGTVQQFVGGSWTVVGTAGFTPSVAVEPDLGIAPDGTLYFAYGDFTQASSLTVKKFDGVNWVTVGSPGFSAPSASRTNTLVFGPNGTPYAGAHTGTGVPFVLSTHQFNGTDWVQLDTALQATSNPMDNVLAISPNGTVYSQSVNSTSISGSGRGNVSRWDGTNWQTVGTPDFTLNEPVHSSFTLGLDQNPIFLQPDVRFLGGILNKATAYRYGLEYAGVGTDIYASDSSAYVLVAVNSDGCISRDTIYVDSTIPLSVIASVTVDSNVSCNSFANGGATASATAGTMPYTYAWSNSATTASITGVVAGTYAVTVTDGTGSTSTASTSITEPAMLAASTVVDSNATCNGFSDGGATASATGGSAPYTYSWSNGATTASITGIVAGTYSVSITDNNGCGPATSTVSITEPSALVASAMEDSSASCNSCADGGATAIGTGGTMPYTYSWSNSATTASITGVVAGTYSVTVTDNNGCTDSASVAVTSGPNAMVVVDSNASCNGFADGGATASTTGGTAPYTYLWSNAATTASITGITAGSYTVTITDGAGLTSTASTSITEPAMLAASTVVDSNATCNGFSDGGATASATGGTAPYTYSWSNGATTASITGIVAGTYTVSITDNNGCGPATSTVSITEPSALIASAIEDSAASCNSCSDGGATASGAGGTMPYTYNWSNSATTASITGVVAGTYSVTLTDGNGCTDSTTVVVTSGPNATVVVDSNASCNGFSDGGATASTTGGTMPYTYLWSNSATTTSINGLAAGTYTVTVTDAAGLTGTTSVTINEPTILVASTVGSNANCNGAADGGATASATGGTSPYSYLWNNGSTAAVLTGIGAGSYSVTVTDANGCSAISSTSITEPTAIAVNNVIIKPDCGSSNGDVNITVSGGNAPYTYLWSNGAATEDLSSISSGAYTVTITDVNTCSATFTYTVSNAGTLIASASNTEVSCYGNADGSIDITPMGGTGAYTFAWSNGSTTEDLGSLVAGVYTLTLSDSIGCQFLLADTVLQPDSIALTVANNAVTCFGAADGTVDLTVAGGTNPYTYAWSNGATTEDLNGLVAGTYSVTVTDQNGCTDSTSTTVVQPTVVLASAIADSNASCNGFSDGGATASATGGTMPYTYAWSNSATTTSITGVGAGTYSVTITDANGCTDSTAISILQPALLSAATVVDSNATCNGFTDGGATAAATGGTGAYTYLWSNSATTASITGVVASTYSVTITDANGCTDSSSVTIAEPALLSAVSVVDSNASCNGFANGGATASATGGTMPYSYAWNNSATTASITGVVAGTYSITITDANGCSDSASISIAEPALLSAASVVDSNASCNSFSNGGATASATGGTMPYSYAWSNSATSASITGVVAGTYSVTITDANGCTDSSSLSITEPAVLNAVSIVDSNATCNGFANGGATASATGGTMPYTYSWSNSATTGSITGVMAGTYSVTITDANGCTDSTSIAISEPALLVTVGVVDSNVSCNAFSDGGASASATGGTMPYTYSWSNSATTASITGVVTGTYSVTITDANGCTDSTAVAILEPAVLSVNVGLDSNESCVGAANGGLTAQVNGGTMPYTYSWSNGATSVSATGLVMGTYSVTITDANGCSTSDLDSIIIQDATPPTVLTNNITVYLDANAQVSITTGQIDNNTFDACGIDSLYLSDTLFGCGDTGANTVMLYASDVNGNTDSAAATVTVLDTLGPIVQTQNLTVYLDANGLATITASSVDNNSFDSCGVASVTLDSTSFDCSETGPNTVTLTVTDVNGNANTGTAIITVLDTLIPTVIAQDLTIYLDANGLATVTASAVDNGSMDNCGIATLTLDSTQFDCNETGSNTVILTAVDPSGNVNLDTAIITVLDTLMPTAIAQNLTVYLDASGQVSVTASAVDNNSVDNCSIASLTLDSTQFDCSEVGANTVVLTVTDVNGNSDTATATITVTDTLTPTVQTQNITLYLDANGLANTTAASIDNGSIDNCSIASVSLDSTSFDCSEVGANTVTLTATDVNGNSDTATAVVTVLDTLVPTVMTQNITLYLDANGQASTTAAAIDNGSFDNCSVDSIALDSTAFDCSETGANTVNLTVFDVNGNSNSGTATITVLDTLAPILTVANDTSVCAVDTSGAAVSYSNSANDNCSAGSIVQLNGLPSGSTFPIGITTNVFEVSDASGNVTTDSFTVEVYGFPALSIAPVGSICETADPVNLNALPTGGTFSGPGIVGNTFDPTQVSSGNQPLTYTYTTAQGCEYSEVIFADVRENPEVILGSFEDSICIELDVVACPVATPAGGVYSGAGIDSILLYTATAGLGQHWISYTYTDSYGCSSTDSTLADIVQCIDPLSVNGAVVEQTQWKVFPNPNNGNFRVQHNHRGEVSARLYSINGALVKDIPVLNQDHEIILDNEVQGVFMLHIVGHQVSETIRIVIQ